MQVHRGTCTARTWLQVAVFLSLFLVTKQRSLSSFQCYLIRNPVENEDTGSGLKNSSSFNKATNLNCSWMSHNIYTADRTVELNIFESVKLKVDQNISETVTFVWWLKKNNISHVVNSSRNSSHTCLELERATGKQAGIYELFIQSDNSNYSIYFEVKIRSRPKKPSFTLGHGEYLNCFSGGYPKPVVYWTSCSPQDVGDEQICHKNTDSIPYPESNNDGNTQVGSTIALTSIMEKNIYCCAVNDLGSECSQLYTIDLTSETSPPEILLKTGELFVMRCWGWYTSYKFTLKWDTESREQMVSFNTSKYRPEWNKRYMFRVLFASFNGGSSRNITCTSTVHPNKTQRLKVIDSGFIDMDTSSVEHDIDPKQDLCLLAEWKAYPVVRCAWIHNAMVTPCSLVTKENGQSQSEYCLHDNMPGEYTFYIDNVDVQLRKTFTVNLLQIPEVECKMTNQKNISCKSQGYPLPIWLWMKSGGGSNCDLKIEDGFTNGLSERHGNNWVSSSTLDVENQAETVTICSCAVNSVGRTCAEMLLKQFEHHHVIVPTVLGLSCSLCVTIILFALILRKYKKKYKYESQLQMIQFIGPSDNEYIYIDLSVLSYDVKKWEFPRENLEFGNTIGSGAFGKVVTAKAYGISKSGVSLQVAVKMLKENPDAPEKDALMSELKMMTQIGHHDNIVNLLGACTAPGPIYLIFEYCPHGDLLNYLKSRRDSFHKTWSDVVQDNNFTFYHNFNQDEKFRERPVTVLSNRSYTWITTEQECDTNQHNEDLLVPHPEVLQAEEVKYQNARNYDEEDLNILTFEDLLTFSYQVAKGMEFLESKLCIHRDLAARNILINSGKVAKICDFGLARDIENDSSYVVKGNARLPVKWMAPESIFDGIYTIRSDVWSYGILLWEIFSLGINPYPGIPVDAQFYKLLQSGFKMDQPFYATDEIYFLMQSCWAFDSKKRPSFSELVSYLGYQISNIEALIYQSKTSGNSDYNCPALIESALIQDLLAVHTPLV